MARVLLGRARWIGLQAVKAARAVGHTALSQNPHFEGVCHLHGYGQALPVRTQGCLLGQSR